MALKATIFKAVIQVADIDRGYYQEHALTLARHPSETDSRMMIRLLAFAIHASESLKFTKGLSTDDEPDLWQKTLSDEVEIWIELGEPGEKRIRKACNTARQVFLYCYGGGRSVPLWWEQNSAKLNRLKNLCIINLPKESTAQLGSLAQRNMNISFTIQENHVLVSDGDISIDIGLSYLKPPDH
jgi:uncharacterized protein YaeQ